MMRKISLIIIFLIVFSSLNTSFIKAFNKEGSKEPLIAYKSQVIPNLDGIISENEWNDTQIHSFKRNDSEYAEAIVYLNCSFKYDKNYLYILSIIDNISYMDNIFVIIVVSHREYFDYGTMYGIRFDGTIGDVYKAPYFYLSPSSSLDINGSAIYTYKKYIFEIIMNLSYLNITNFTAPFNIGYALHIFGTGRSLYSTSMVSVGKQLSAEPGITISNFTFNNFTTNHNENDKNNIKDDYNFIFYFLLLSVSINIVAVSYVLYFKWRNKK